MALPRQRRQPRSRRRRQVAGPAQRPPSSSAASGAAQPKAGGNLRVGAVGDVANVDPQSWGPKNGFSVFMAYDTLTTYDLDLKPLPQLAESWQQSGDGKQLTVNLRKGVQFHSGRELTSEDVVASLARPLDAKLQGAIASFTILQGFVPTGTTFEARDKYTVEIKSPVAVAVDLRLLPGPAYRRQRSGRRADHPTQRDGSVQVRRVGAGAVPAVREASQLLAERTPVPGFCAGQHSRRHPGDDRRARSWRERPHHIAVLDRLPAAEVGSELPGDRDADAWLLLHVPAQRDL